MTLTFCHRCRASLAAGAKFCGECGAPSRAHARSQHAELRVEARRDRRHVAAVAIVFVGVLGGMVALAPFVEGQGVECTAVAAFGAEIAAGLAACVVLGRGALRASFAGRPRAVDLILALLVGGLGFAVASVYVDLLTPDELSIDRPLGVPLILTTVIGAPLIEEWIDRGVLWRALRPLTSTAGVIVTSAALFALMHGLNGGWVLELPHRFVAGLGLGWLRARSGSLVPGILAHAVLNGLAVGLE